MTDPIIVPPIVGDTVRSALAERDRRQVPLRNAQGAVTGYAIIDVEDAPLIESHRWWDNGHGYAIRSAYDGGRLYKLFMHRLILGLPHGDPRQGDHINRDRRDNRRANLRIVTPAENAQNTSARLGSSTYRGVTWNARKRKWQAQVKAAGRTHYLGLFIDEDAAGEAAQAFRLRLLQGAVD